MMKYARLFVGALLFFAAPALAQYQVPANNIPVGRGAGGIGFGSVLGSAGSGAKCLIDTVPPSFGTCPAAGVTPGGATGQIQFNNGGTLGGFTASGDATINPNTGVVTLLGNKQCVFLESYGGGTSASGATNVAAFASAVAALGAGNGGCISFNSGTYSFSSQVVVNMPSKPFDLNLRGTGQNSTTLFWTSNTGGLAFNYNSSNNVVTMSDMSIAPFGNAAGTAISLNQVAGGGGPTFSSFNRLTVGCGSGCGFWAAGFISGGVTAINITGSTFYGSSGSIGAQCQGQSLSDYTVTMNISTSNFWNHSAAVLMSNYCQSLFVAQSNIIGGSIGVFVNGTAGIQSNLNVSGSEVSLQSGQAILVSQSLLDFQIANNFLFGLAGQDVISAGAASFGNIVGNSIACTSGSGNGVLLQGSTSNIMVGTNVIRDCGIGVVVGAGVTKVNVQSNLYNNNGTNVSNSGGGSNTIGGGSQ